MPLIIEDEFLSACELNSTEFLQEIAIHLFDCGKLTLNYAAKMAQMDSCDFRELLKTRKIPLYRYDLDDFEIDLKNLQELGKL